MAISTRILVLGLLVALRSSCTPWRQKYLKGGVNSLTMDEVTKTLGPPDGTQTLKDNSIVWKYRYTSSSVTGSQYGVVGGSECTEYILTFDKDEILRQTRRQGC